ncbi:repressor LexA [Halolactibacillus halophilus]|uniref:Repressor LexA n=1 Tax=Halolactibacillus halophilus TaxID=306540 RepID=A0A1I5S5V5_9BACI|nr:XRE family transcriptional regulator [Halolactibacillus halophilus]GEM02769.1 hypothetical protein HHA03_23010 [Halolactibacillus halophilus]SFP66092.1 repressor LexA [Halolactibacillus halophilus]
MDLRIFIGNKIKQLREKHGLNQDDLAKKLSTTKQAISRYEKGDRQANQDILFALSNMFNVDIDYFFPVRAHAPTNVFKSTGNFIKIPIIGEIACGDPILAVENVIDYHVEPADLLPAGNLFYLKAKGDSMEPKIPNQSLVLIREQSDVESGEIAAVLVNGDTEATLKRVKKQSGYLILDPDNSNYEPIIVDEKNPARIIGKALQITAKL